MDDPVPQWAMDALSAVYDPCCREKGISVVDMGLVRAVVLEGGHARVELLLTSGWCPFASRILDEVERAVIATGAAATATVEVVWDEAWTAARLSDTAARKLRFLPEPALVPDRAAYIAAHRPTTRPAEEAC
jgi:metal-sulfur cluster biosynthetic enzyme